MILLNGYDRLFTQFPNGETVLRSDEVLRVLNTTCEISNVTFKYENDSDLIKLMMLKRYLDNEVYTVHLKITYMPYSRMDRVEGSSAFTLKYVSEFINLLNFNTITVLEPHSTVTPALLNQVKSVYVNQKEVEKLFEDLQMNSETDYIMFPDNGAASRYKHLKFKNVLIGHKNRDFVSGEITKLDVIGDVINPKKVLILDDLSSYGGTFVHASKKLRELGFETVNLYVTHAENSIFKGELFNHIDTVYTTNSLMTEENHWQNKKFEKQLIVKDVLNIKSK